MAVANISARVASFHQRQLPFRLYHGSTNSTQARKVDPARMIDTSSLNHVLKVDKVSKTCLVEPNVPMDQLVDAILPHGLLPKVVMEFPGITVGGGFSGTAGESSGFKYGFFEKTVSWIEVVLPTGQVVQASPSENADLFDGMAGTLGTLGVVTLLKIDLIDAKRYVELTYHPTTDVDDALSTMKLATEVDTNDYVDGIVFATDRGVIISGRLTDDLPLGARVQHFSRPQDPWFYQHAETVTRQRLEPVKEYTPIRDYLFRYDRCAFWTGKYAFEYFMTPCNRITRWALDYFMHTRVMYHALHASGHASQYMIQDLLLPHDTAADFVRYVSAEFGLFPLWLCPFKVDGDISLHPRMQKLEAKTAKTRNYVNVGVWGPGSADYDKFVVANRRLERKVREFGGIKWLYAQAFYTEDEFWSLYDRDWYDGLRNKYQATYLPTVFDKVKVQLSSTDDAGRGWAAWLRFQLWSVWPVSGLYGVWKTLSERDYLLAR